MKNIVSTIDRIICYFFGLDMSETTPHKVARCGNQLVIINTESFKRHQQAMPVSKIDLVTMSKINKNKLGVALGMAIASNLVISFDKIPIKRNDIHA